MYVKSRLCEPFNPCIKDRNDGFFLKVVLNTSLFNQINRDFAIGIGFPFQYTKILQLYIFTVYLSDN